MIKDIKIYTVVCDHCGKDSNEDEEYAGWNDVDYAEDVAMEFDWIKEDDKHYCPECFTYDDEGNVIIKTN